MLSSLRDRAKICAFALPLPSVIEFGNYLSTLVALGGLVVSVLTTGPRVRGFKPGRGRWIFKGDKNP
jgi:hypothetical protein